MIGRRYSIVWWGNKIMVRDKRGTTLACNESGQCPFSETYKLDGLVLCGFCAGCRGTR